MSQHILRLDNIAKKATERYKFGFNGMEKDNAVKGEGNSYDFGARIYDSRLGRWMSVDPLHSKYPAHSGYNFCYNSPLIFVDVDGKDAVATWDQTTKTKTLVIKATYHYIEGTIDKAVLDGVQAQYGTFNKIDYKGEKVDVRFEISFVPEPEGTDLTKFDGTNGQNSLSNQRIAGEELGSADYNDVIVDNAKIKETTVTTPDGKVHTFPDKDILKMQIDNLAHEIGHNIGMQHSDLGVMKQNIIETTEMEDRMAPPGSNKKTYVVSYLRHKVTKENAQLLTSRIDDMTSKGRDYWAGKTDPDGRDNSGTGITKLKE